MTSTSTPDHLVLVGMTGVGKSTVGRLVAARLDRPFVDLDAEIERRDGRSVREVFATDGEGAFRDLEAEVLAAVLASETASVVATGGGAILRPENRSVLAAPAIRVVWLMAGPDTVLDRVRAGMHRPLLDEDPEATLAAMWVVREPLYHEVADAVVAVDGRTISEVVEAVLR